MGTTGQSITLANSIIGVGILAMPFCYQQCGVVLATLILLFMGLVSRLCCYFLLKSALMARRRNFEFLGFHVFGPAGKMAVELGIIGFLMGTCIAYFVVVGDLGPQIIAKMFNINQSDILRTSIMVIVSLVCVLPLGLLRNVDSLSNVSAATIGFYFCLVIKVIAEATSQLLAGEWQSQVAMWKPSGLLQCVPIFSMALFCQTQLFEIFESMPSLSLEKMNLVTKNAINICTGVYFTLGLFGYIAFCSQTISGNILMSLSPTMASDVIKLGFVMSVACSFPLIIFPCRASLYSFLYKKVHSSHHDHLIHNSIPESTFRCITVAIIAVALFISLLIPNIELVLGLVGSTIGVLICVVFPAACFVNVTFKNTNERVLAKGVIVLGLVIMVLGTYANLQAAENQVDRFDEKYITQERIDKIVEDFFESKKLEKNSFDPPVGHLGNGHEDTQKALEKAPKLVIKDSEIQPPNPEPPESHSKEIADKEETVVVKTAETLGENKAKLHEINDNNESHPRNLKAKLNNESRQNGVVADANQIKERIEKENLAQEKKKQEEENIKHAEKLQDKIDILKHQQLIDTIKQHGEEQKELLEEQNKILHEIEKTKEEIKQNKKEANSEEAKKLAVESIQKIALKAIETLGGVSDKPIHNDKPEAVQQIAKHAVESIVAIQDAGKDKSGQGNDAVMSQNDANANNNKQVPVLNIIDRQKSQVSQNSLSGGNIAVEPQKTKGVAQNLQINARDIQVQAQNSDVHAQDVQNKDINNNVVEAVKMDDIRVNSDQITNNVGQNVQNQAQIPPKSDTVLQQNVLNAIHQIELLKEHLHSPDEPQSYKQGEDAQKQKNDENPVNNNEIRQSLPLPLALISNSQIGDEKSSNPVNGDGNSNPNINNNADLPKQIENNLVNNNGNGVPSNEPIESANIIQHPVQEQAQIRQKREVVDCTEKNALKPDEKRIYDTLPTVIPKNIVENEGNLLSFNVDLNDHLNRIPVDTNIIHRSLKSFDESER